MIEKPIATTEREAREITAAAAQAGVRMMVAHVLHFDPRYAKLQEAIDQGEIGDEEIESPLLVTWSYGKGRSAAFASDCSPHWAEYFQPWEYYGKFWVQAVRWLAGEEK